MDGFDDELGVERLALYRLLDEHLRPQLPALGEPGGGEGRDPADQRAAQRGGCQAADASADDVCVLVFDSRRGRRVDADKFSMGSLYPLLNTTTRERYRIDLVDVPPISEPANAEAAERIAGSICLNGPTRNWRLWS